MEFPHRRDEDHQHHHHHHQQHQHHHHHNPQLYSRQEEDFGGYEGDRYPRTAPVYEPSPVHVLPTPYPYVSHAPGPFAYNPPAGPYGDSPPATAPYAHTPPSGSYGTHVSSGYFHPHSHEAPFEASATELPVCLPDAPQGQLAYIFCKKNVAFNLAVDHNTVIMKPADTQDEAQQWIKDSSYGMRVKDNYGYPAFALVNKKSRMILKHSKEKGQQVLLMEYQPDIKDDDILWSESQDFGEGFKTLRCASDTLLNLTVFEGAKTVRNGSPLVLDTWHKGNHQLWKAFPL